MGWGSKAGPEAPSPEQALIVNKTQSLTSFWAPSVSTGAMRATWWIAVTARAPAVAADKWRIQQDASRMIVKQPQGMMVKQPQGMIVKQPQGMIVKQPQGMIVKQPTRVVKWITLQLTSSFSES